MDSLYSRMTEDSIDELAKAGCTIDISMRAYGDGLKTRVEIRKGSTSYGGGLELLVEAEGADGAAALRGAVATAETYLHAVPVRTAPKLPEFGQPSPEPPLGGRLPTEVDPGELLEIPLVAELLDATDARRASNSDLAEALDARAARELEPHL